MGAKRTPQGTKKWEQLKQKTYKCGKGRVVRQCNRLREIMNPQRDSLPHFPAEEGSL